MKTRAAVLREAGTPWEITELELDDPKENEVLVRMDAAGLCHSDEHIRARGAGRQNLCDQGLYAGIGCLLDQTFRFHSGGRNTEDFGAMCLVGAFSQYSVLPEGSCVKIEDWVPMELAALVACGVTTGFCSAVYAGDVRPGDVVVIFGTGGVGMNAVQGARYAGAKHVVVIDPNDWKQQRALEFGATHAFGDPAKVREVVVDLTRGQLADKVICTVGEMNNDVLKAAVDLMGKGGTTVITAVGAYEMALERGGGLPGYHRRIQGSLFGGANPLYDIPMILSLWHEGHIKLPELITKRYALDEINQGYADLMDGKNIRGVIVHEH